jgi:hypothetical protein
MDYSSYPLGIMPGSSQHVIIASPPNTDRGSTPHSRRYRRRSPPCQLPVSMITPRTKCTVAETTGSLYGMGALYGFSSHVRQRPRRVGYGASFSAVVKAVCRCFSIVFTSWTCYKKKPGGRRERYGRTIRGLRRVKGCLHSASRIPQRAEADMAARR